MWCGFGDLREQSSVRKKKRITRMLQLQATVKRFQFDFNLTMKVNICWLAHGFKDKSLRADRRIKLHKARLNHQILMLLSHNVLIYCS